MQQAQFAGPIGALTDPATGQSHQAKVWGSYTYTSQMPGDQSQVINQALIGAITQTIQQKLVAQQIAIPTIAHSMPALVPEILQASNLATMGTQLSNVQINVQVEMPQAPAPPAQMPPDPNQAAAAAMAQAGRDQLDALDPRNKEYAAQVKIGGFKLNASTDEGFDSEGLKDQVKDKVKSNLIWYGAGCFIVLLIFIGLAILAWYIYSQAQESVSGPGGGPARATGSAKTVTWDGKTPYSCGAGDNVKIVGTTANLKTGTAVSALGGCVVTLENCTITAPTGISAIGNSKITVKGGSVTGKKVAAKALGGAEIVFEGTKVTGKKQALGKAKITGP